MPISGTIRTASFDGVGRSEVALSYLPKPDYLEFTLPDTHVVLITNEGSALTTEVAQTLEAEGNQVVVLNLPHLQNNASGKAVSLKSNSDEDIQAAFSEITSQYGKIGSFIHLHPHLEFQNGNFAQHFGLEKQILQTIFLLAKHLQQPLNELGSTQRANFLTVTRMDGQLGLGGRGNISVLAGGFPGMVKCLNLEWSPVFCRALDLQPELAHKNMAQQVLAEFHDADVATVEVGYSEEGRKTISAKPVTVAEHQEITTSVTNDSVFLVSGGARGVTATCVIEMAKVFQCKFILLGRSDADYTVPDYAKKEDDEGALKRLIMNDLKEKGEKPSLPMVKSIYSKIVASKEIAATLHEITSAGGQAAYLKGDVTNISSFKAELDQITGSFGKITGLIHGAGRLADKYIQDKTKLDFDNVLSVKLDGLLALLQAVDIHHLDHLILFSSVAGFYGNAGQTDYAMANEILSKAAHLFKKNHPNTQVSAINWGAWDSGMVSGALKAQFEAAGVKLVSSQGGAALMINEFNTLYADQPQVIIGETLPAAVSYIREENQTYRVRRKLKLEDNPFLNHHVIQEKAVLPTVNAVSWMAQAGERLYPDYRIFKVEDVKIFKGIVFDGLQKEDYLVELKELQTSKEQIVFETSISSKGGKLPTYHYKAKITLVSRKIKPDAPVFEPQLSGTYKPTDGKQIYRIGDLFHGPYFQGLEQILDYTDQQMVLSCQSPEVPLDQQGQFPVKSVNPFFADIQYQGMVVWVALQNEGARSLPLATNTVTIYETVPFEKQLFVHIKVVEADDFKMVADCTVYDENGKVYMITEGAAVTISKELKW